MTSDLRLADINGDGRDDLLYVNMLNGSVIAWQNGGQRPSSGSALQWDWQGTVSPGDSSRGACVEFGALYGLGRADYIGMDNSFAQITRVHVLMTIQRPVVEPSSNKAWTWLWVF